MRELRKRAISKASYQLYKKYEGSIKEDKYFNIYYKYAGLIESKNYLYKESIKLYIDNIGEETKGIVIDGSNNNLTVDEIKIIEIVGRKYYKNPINKLLDGTSVTTYYKEKVYKGIKVKYYQAKGTFEYKGRRGLEVNGSSVVIGLDYKGKKYKFEEDNIYNLNNILYTIIQGTNKGKGIEYGDFGYKLKHIR